jgi:putative hydrolase of the HAD superfamily
MRSCSGNENHHSVDISVKPCADVRQASVATCPAASGPVTATRLAGVGLSTRAQDVGVPWADAGLAPPARRAVLFDLDDTLYPINRFVLSAVAAATRYLQDAYDVDAEAMRPALVAASRRIARGLDVNLCARQFGLSDAIVRDVTAVMRSHRPRISLPGMAVAALRALRAGWKIGLVTDGMPDVQARKVDALGLEPLVDCIVYAHAHGSGAGKPDREPFIEALRRLEVTPDRAIFVGDDDYCDIFGASRVGMRTVLAAAWNTQPRGRPVRADTVVVSLRTVPQIAERLLDTRWRSDVASGNAHVRADRIGAQ